MGMMVKVVVYLHIKVTQLHIVAERATQGYHSSWLIHLALLWITLFRILYERHCHVLVIRVADARSHQEQSAYGSYYYSKMSILHYLLKFILEGV